MNTSSRPLPEPGRRVYLGRIAKVRGLRGDVKIAPLTWRPERFEELEGIWVQPAEGEERYLIFKRLRIEAGIVYARFHEAPRRELAEELVGAELFIDEEERDPLPQDHYYLDDLLGCEVICSKYGRLGTIRSVMDLPANDVWVVDGGEYGEVLIPAIRDVVGKIDLEAKHIEVTLLDGLIDEEKDSKGKVDTRHSKRSPKEGADQPE